MKKSAVLIACIVMLFTFTACNEPATVEDFLKHPDVQSSLDSVKGTITEMGMNMEVIGDGNKMTYAYTYLEQIENVEMAKVQIDASLATQTEVFENVADSLKTEGVIDPIVIVKYINADGTEITSKEFTVK